MDTEATYHHLIPQTYMKAWKHGNSSVYIVEKGTNVVLEKSTKKFGGIDNYHSLRAGSLYHTEEDCKKFFKPLEIFTVKIDDKVVNSQLEMNKQFYKFDEWIIINTYGDILTELEKKTLKNDILSIHVRDIEVGWDRQYENYWNSINQLISNEVYLSSVSRIIPAIKRTELIKFMVSLEWRTKPYHPVLRNALDLVMDKELLGVDLKSALIPENERLYPFLETLFDEQAHSYILKIYRQFLDGSGIIMDEATKFLNESSIILLWAPNGREFITSDNPVCRYTNIEGKTEYIFPINPKIACSVVKGGPQNEYLLQKISEKDLVFLNNKLKEYCYKGYILREKNLSLYF